MTMDGLPTPEQAIDDLAPLVAALHVEFPRVLSSSIRPYFARDGRMLDEVTAGLLFRDQVGYWLKQRNFSIINDGSGTMQFRMRELALKGIEGTLGRWRFKILRSRDGLVPPPRDSERRATFYAQNQLPLPGFEFLQGCSPQYNVVFLWDFNADYTVFSLRIAMPLDAAGAMTHFNKLVDNPQTDADIDLAGVRRKTAETLAHQRPDAQ